MQEKTHRLEAVATSTGLRIKKQDQNCEGDDKQLADGYAGKSNDSTDEVEEFTL